MADSQRTSRTRNWNKEDMEGLVHWMDDHQQSLRGKQSVWHKDVKELVFVESEDIMIKRISMKAANMKGTWRNARKSQEQSGSGVREEDYAPTFNALLGSKCPLFWRLYQIWCTRPNATPVLIVDSTQDRESVDPDMNIKTKGYEYSDEELGWEDSPRPSSIARSRPSSIVGSRPSSIVGSRPTSIIAGSSKGPQKLSSKGRVLHDFMLG